MAMRIVRFLFPLVLVVYGVSSHETEESSTGFTFSDQNTEQVTHSDASQRTKTTLFLSQPTLTQEPVYGTRVTESAAESSPTARYNLATDVVAEANVKSDAGRSPQDSMQYPPARGMFRYPPALYYPESLNPSDSYQNYPTQGTKTVDTSRTARYNSGTDVSNAANVNNEASRRTQDSMRNPLARDIFQYPPSLYYPEPYNPSDSYENYPAPLESLNNSPYTDDSEELNMTSPYLSFHPGFSAARIYRRERYPSPFGNIENDEFLLRNEPTVINVGDPLPFVPYPFSSYFLPPAIPSRSDEKELDIFIRPNYFDRESGTEAPENVLPKKEMAKEQPVIEQKEVEFSDSASSTFANTAAPAEPIPSRFLPRGPFPPVFYPPDILPSYTIARGPVPVGVPSVPVGIPPVPVGVPPVPVGVPTVPVGVPFAAPANENLLNSALDKPISESANVESIPDSSFPLESNSPDGTGVVADPESAKTDPRQAYEYGYQMNDGMGADQHSGNNA